MKKIILYLALITLFPAATFAGKPNDGNTKGPVSEYVNTHVMPVVMKKRQTFDAFLSATEKNELASVREELQQLRQNHRAAMQVSEEMTEENAPPRVPNEAWGERRANMKELMQQVRIIAERHSDQLDKIYSELAPQKAQWKSDIAQIVASKKNEGEESSFSYSDKGFSHFGMGGRFGKWSRSGFLLLDPSTAATSDNARQADIGNDIPAATSMSIFPNPAANEFSLNLSGIPGENKLTVTDMTGKIIVEKENLMPSETETISCNDLSNGVIS